MRTIDSCTFAEWQAAEQMGLLPDEYTVVDHLASMLTMTQFGATEKSAISPQQFRDMRLAWAKPPEEPSNTPALPTLNYAT